MDEMNNLPENQNNEELKEHSIPTPETAKVSEPIANIPAPKIPIPKLPLIIGGAVAGVAAIAIIVALILVCGHEHNYGTWTIVDEPTCTVAGVEERICEWCNEKESRPVSSYSHKHSDMYEYSDDYHWRNCIVCGEEDKSIHTTDAEGVCSVCNHIVSPTLGVMYDLSDDGTYAEVIGYEGTAKKVRIADNYEGLPVKTIHDSAFKNNDLITSVIIPDSVITIGCDAFCHCNILTSVVIGNSVTVIGERAFSDCDSLDFIVIGNSVTTIGGGAFGSCASLTSVVIGNSVTTIGDQVFFGCVSLKSVVIGDSVTTIGFTAFYDCPNLTSIIIPNSVSAIGILAFSDCDNLTSVVIGDGVTTIGGGAFDDCARLKFNEYENCKYLGTKDNPYYALIYVTTENLSSYTIHENTKVISDYAFDDCERLRNIYYAGSESDWSEISIGVKNYNLTNATIHYNYVPEN